MRLLLLVALAGCQLVFPASHDPVPPDGLADADAPPGLAPINETRASQTAAASLLAIDLQPTPGNALILIAVIRTANDHIASVTDNAGTIWTRALDGVDGVAGAGQRVEIWYATEVKTLSQVTVALGVSTAGRPMAVNITEWAGLAALPEPVGNSVRNDPDNLNDNPRTGKVQPAARALVIATAALDEVTSNAALEDSPGFHALTDFSTGTGIGNLKGVAAYADVPAGDYIVRWKLDIAQSWSAGIASFLVAN